MSYFADLTPYTYRDVSGPWAELLNVGWLDSLHQYTTGPVPTDYITRLGKLCAHSRVEMTRGIHPCEIPPCTGQMKWPPITAVIDNKEVILGHGEIRIGQNGGIWYDAPDLIYHYVTVHHYRPPEEFIDGVLLYS